MTASAPPSTSARAEARPRTGATPRGPLRPDTLALVRGRLDGAALRRLFRWTDTVVATCGALAAAGLCGPASLWRQPVAAAAPVAVEAVAALAALAALDGYRFGRREPKWLQFLRVLLAAAVALALGAALARVLPGGDMAEASAGAAAVGVALLLAHAWAALRVRAWRRAGRLTPNVVIVGATADAGRLIARALRTREVNVLGVFDDRGERAPRELHGVPVLGDTASLLDHRLLPYVDRVVVAVGAASQARVRALLERLRTLPNAVALFADLGAEGGRSDALARLLDAPLAAAGSHPESRRALVKRAADLAGAAVALTLLSPLMLALAMLVKLDSPGPALFFQRRYGFNNELITVWKFRSMQVQPAPAPGEVRQLHEDEARVTRLGRFIRRTSLDELPQLFNVLRGEMSLVGPRPHAVGMKTAGTDSRAFADAYAWRHRMKPGLTGWAQVNGSRGPVRTPEEVRRRVALDLAYIERQSFWFDVWILLLTLPRLLGDGRALR